MDDPVRGGRVFRPGGSGAGLAIILSVVSRPRRLDAIEYVGLRQYYLTICTYQRGRNFIDPDTIALVRTQFLRVAIDEQFEILVYCFMPDHLHAVVTARSEAADVQRFVRLAKQRSGFRFVQVAGRRLWQESYFDRAVRSDESLPDIVKYIVENPVRARLVAAPAEYPHWGSQIYSREEILEFIASG